MTAIWSCDTATVADICEVHLEDISVRIFLPVNCDLLLIDQLALKGVRGKALVVVHLPNVMSR